MSKADGLTPAMDNVVTAMDNACDAMSMNNGESIVLLTCLLIGNLKDATDVERDELQNAALVSIKRLNSAPIERLCAPALRWEDGK